MSDIKVIANKEDIVAIADAVRAKTGSSEAMSLNQIANNIGGISGGSGIIDVGELPTEEIREDCFYRLIRTNFIYNRDIFDSWKCYCVNTLPEIGEPASTDMVNVTAYYSIQDNDAYGYIDDTLSIAGGVPVGWYTLTTLAPMFNVDWGGVITDIEEDKNDGLFHVLLNYDFYIYKNEWSKIIFAYEKLPKFDIVWDGDMTDKFVLDMTSLGYENLYYVKVSDDVFNSEQLIGATCNMNDGYNYTITSDSIDSTTYVGALNIYGGVIIAYSADDLNAALGLPTGYITNGTYFGYASDTDTYTNRFTAPRRITKIDGEYLDNSGFASVAFTGDYHSLLNTPTIYTNVIRYDVIQGLHSTYKSNARKNIDVYSKSEVDTKIAEAISGAIGGSY